MDYKYKAFVSHSHFDADWANWLVSAIESYQVPEEHVKKGQPERLGNLFINKIEWRPLQDPILHVKEALDESEYLIVVCSPCTQRTPRIQLEIEYFRSLGREDRIIALLVDGLPQDSFPAALAKSAGFNPYVIDVNGEKIKGNNVSELVVVRLLELEAKYNAPNSSNNHAQGQWLAINYPNSYTIVEKRHGLPRWVWGIALLLILSLVVCGTYVAQYDLTFRITSHAYQKQLRIRERQINELLKNKPNSLLKAYLESELDHVAQKLLNVDAAYQKFQVDIKDRVARLDNFQNDISIFQLLSAQQGLVQGNAAQVQTAFEQVRHEAQGHIRAAAEAAFQLGYIAEKRMNYTLALQEYEEAARLDADNGMYLRSAAQIAGVLGQEDKAISYYVKEINLGGVDEKFLAGTYDKLGDLWSIKREYTKAAESYKESLKIKRNAFGDIHVSLAETYKKIGDVLARQKQYDHASFYLKKALTIKHKFSTETKVSFVSIYYSLGAVFFKQKNYTEAIKYYEELLSSKRDVQKKSLLASTYNQLAKAWFLLGKYDLSVDYYTKFLTKSRADLGQQHILLAQIHRELAHTLFAKGDFEKAIEHYKKDLDISRHYLAEDHLSIATTKSALAKAFMKQKKYIEALRFYNKVYDVFVLRLGLDHDDVRSATNRIKESIEAYMVEVKGDEVQKAKKILEINDRWLVFVQRVLLGTLSNSQVAYEITQELINGVEEPELVCKHAVVAFAIRKPYSVLEPLLSRCVQVGEQKTVYRQVGYIHLTLAAYLNKKAKEAKNAAREFRKSFSGTSQIVWDFQGTIDVLKKRKDRRSRRAVQFLESLNNSKLDNTYQKRVEKALGALGV